VGWLGTGNISDQLHTPRQVSRKLSREIPFEPEHSPLDQNQCGVIIQQLNFGNIMEPKSDTTRDLSLLEQIERDPNVTQASLATQLGVAVGTVNWHLKRLIAKGYVKVKRAERRKLRYIITPEGIAFRAHLTVDYIEQSMLLYRHTRKRVREILADVKRAGYDSVRVVGDGDIADICRLTCLEQSVQILDQANIPTLEVRGVKVSIKMIEEQANVYPPTYNR
jgi:DNA-binding MarR family transcriptional regulator